MPSSPSVVSVLYFAALRDLVGQNEEQVALPEAPLPIAALLEVLEQRHTALRGRLQAVRVAVNEEFAPSEGSVWGGDVVALIPPVSGG